MMPSRILISVIIPAYNYAAVIERALDSVLGQWADDLELLVIDDGSEDDTATVLAGYVARHGQPIRVVRQENAGPGAARNHGIRLARGEFVLLLDADDELLPTALATLRRVVQGDPGVGLVLGGQLSVYPDGRERLRLPGPTAGPPSVLVRRYLLEKRISIAHGCSLFRRELLRQRPYPESLRGGEDIAVFAYLLAHAAIAVVREPLARIHKHADSLRHHPAVDEDYVARMVREVFSTLPGSCQPLRRRYEAQRYLSLFRAARTADDPGRAWHYYCRALRLSPRQALRWDYLRKVLRFRVGG